MLCRHRCGTQWAAVHICVSVEQVYYLVNSRVLDKKLGGGSIELSDLEGDLRVGSDKSEPDEQTTNMHTLSTQLTEHVSLQTDRD